MSKICWKDIEHKENHTLLVSLVPDIKHNLHPCAARVTHYITQRWDALGNPVSGGIRFLAYLPLL
jgi:hypothetical protein